MIANPTETKMNDGKKESEGALSKPLLYLWLAGVAIVAYSFLWHGCIHFTCSSGINGEVSFRSRRSSGATKFMGMYDSVAQCELACAEGKTVCQSFTYFVSGDLTKQCFASLESGWSIQADESAVSGRPYFLSKATLFAAAHPFGLQFTEKLADLLASIQSWPIFAKLQELAAQLPPRPALSDKAWLCVSALLFFWPALLHILLGASPPAEVRQETATKLRSIQAEVKAKRAPPPEPAPEPTAETPGKIPILHDVMDMGHNVGRSFEEGFKGFTAGLHSLMKPKEEEAAAPAPATN